MIDDSRSEYTKRIEGELKSANLMIIVLTLLLSSVGMILFHDLYSEELNYILNKVW